MGRFADPYVPIGANHAGPKARVRSACSVRGCCETSLGPCTVSLARSDEIDAVMQLCDDAAQWLVDQGVVQWKPGQRFPVPRGVYFPQV
jgi:hypothetical protein